MATPEETLSAYLRVFEPLDPSKFLKYYNLPCLFISPAGTFAATDASGAEAIVSQGGNEGRCSLCPLHS
jgi:hypothetical protein